MKSWRKGLLATLAPFMLLTMALGISLPWLAQIGFAYLAPPAQKDTSEEISPWFFRQFPLKIAAQVRALDATPNAQRQAVIASADEPNFRVRLLNSPIENPEYQVRTDDEALKQRIETMLGPPHKVMVAERSLPAGRQTGDNLERSVVLVQTALSDGHWVDFVRRLRPVSRGQLAEASPSLASIGVCAGVGAVLALLASWFAARHIGRPLTELSTAVEQVGGSGDASIRPSGPREIQTLMEAVNRMQERLRRFNQDRTRMFATMSHDLRTPLTRLKVRLEMMEGQPQQKKMLAELDSTNAMIESILLFAKDEAQSEPRSLADLSSLVEGICQQASDAGESITFQGPRNVTISCRPMALRRAICNLVDNAVKYGNCAHVALSPGPEKVTIAVEDEGPGLPWNERERVFEPFYRVDSARDPNTGGVGLGLALTRSIIRDHGGDIILANRKGGGLIARVMLPASEAFAGAKSQTVGSEASKQESGANKAAA